MSANASTADDEKSRAKLEAAAFALGLASSAIALHRETMEAFLADSSAHHPAVGSVLKPLFRSGLDFVRTYQFHMAITEAALAKVRT